MPAVLSGFTITKSADDYLITIEDDEGNQAEYVAQFEQLDLISESIDRQLNGDEEDALAVDDGDE